MGAPKEHGSPPIANYRLTDEQHRLKDAARDFAQRELLPISTEVERAGGPIAREMPHLSVSRHLNRQAQAGMSARLASD